MAISPSSGRGSWVDVRAAAASFFSRDLDLQADRPARLVIDGSIDPRHAAARRLGDDREPALKVHPAPRPAPMELDAAGPENFLQLAEHRCTSLCVSRVPESRFDRNSANIGQPTPRNHPMSRVARCATIISTSIKIRHVRPSVVLISLIEIRVSASYLIPSAHAFSSTTPSVAYDGCATK